MVVEISDLAKDLVLCKQGRKSSNNIIYERKEELK